MTKCVKRDIKLDIKDGPTVLDVQHIAATLNLPAHFSKNTLLVCFSGGSYSRFYFQAEFTGFKDYSFADYMAAKGYAVLTLDHLGMGDSSKPDNVSCLDKTCIAAFNHAAVQSILPEFDSRPHLVGVGHSMGGMALVEQQANHSTFDKIVVLGWTNIGLSLDTRDLDVKSRKDQYVPTDRSQMRSLFHLADVPEDLIRQDDALASLTPSPFAQNAIRPSIVAREACAITCPVFLAYGELDISPDPSREVDFYKNAKRVELNILEGSAHNHNYSASRTKLWDDIAIFANENQIYPDL